uniref:Homeodomain-like domain-containing protein n=1 Tax=Candidatus Kentrum sp. FW TaxID=2126338 RepID=A0A450TKT3_9GAMM|nr:MAG: Homeodomain-like domain-containing protein [Candidatus Kentron sp. FW]
MRDLARRKPVKVLGLNKRTVRRWRRQLGTGNGFKDRRGERSDVCVPANRLTEKEKARIIQVCNQEENRSLAPSQIVPKLADEGVYIASESSLYRVLRKAGQFRRRGRARSPRTIIKPKGIKHRLPIRYGAGTSPTLLRQCVEASTTSIWSRTFIAVKSSAGRSMSKKVQPTPVISLAKDACWRESVEEGWFYTPIMVAR